MSPFDIEYEYARQEDGDNKLQSNNPADRQHHVSSVSITGVPQLAALGPRVGTPSGSSQLAALTGSSGGLIGSSALGGAPAHSSQLGALTGTPNMDGLHVPHNQRLRTQQASSASPARYNRPIYPVTSSGLTSRTSSVDDLDYRSLSYASRSICSSVDSFNTTRSTLSHAQTDV